MPIKSWEQADRAMDALSRLHAECGLAQKNMEAEIARIREACAPLLQRLEAEFEDVKRELIAFGKAHRREFKPREEGGDTRSYEHADVVFGYRATPPQVRIENEEAAVEFLDEFEGGIYLRVKQEPNRDALRDALLNDDERTEEKLAAHGITLQQKDKFFIEVRNGR